MRTRHNVLQTIVSQRFFEPIERYAIEEKYYVEPTRRLLPPGWSYNGSGVWAYYEPPDAAMPTQGWKIHVSATTHSAVEVIERCVPVMVRHGVAFKHACDRLILSFMNSKAWDRGGSGKFITVYPRDDEQFLVLLEELAATTRELNGPYVLSDRRYRDSRVVFYRYGTLRPQVMLVPNGSRHPYLLAPTGERIPEIRGPVYVLPPWVVDIVERNAAAPSAAPADILINNGRYAVKQALGYTNGGGVYFARDTVTGDAVVIKEARPFTNWLSVTDDSTQLLAKEFRLLELVADTGISPKPVEMFRQWEHSYLVQEFVPGLSMDRLAAQQAILLRTRYDENDVRAYRALIGKVFTSLVNAIETLHSRNIVFGDLSPNNVLWVEEEERVRLIDYESAFVVGVDNPTRLTTAGFAAPWSMNVNHDLTRFENDWYAVGALMLSLVMPVSEFIGFAPDGATDLIETLTREAHLPPEYADIVIRLLSRRPPDTSEVVSVLERTAAYDAPALPERGRYAADDELRALARDIASAIVANATPERSDRLFPADFHLIGTNPSGFAYGAAGVLYALSRSGFTPPPECVDWLLRRTLSPREHPPGLAVGLAGIAWSLLEIGHLDEACKVLSSAVAHPLLSEADDLAFGLAGWGLTNLKFFLELRDEEFLAEARRAARALIERATLSSDGYFSWPQGGDTHYGLDHGASGVALFLLYLSLVDDEEQLYDAALRALTYDLSRGVPSDDGGVTWTHSESLQSIVLPYWSYGSAGIGAVALRFKSLRAEAAVDDHLEKIFIDTDRRHAVWPGLRMGLTGLASFHVDSWALEGSERGREAAHNTLRGVLSYGVRDENGLSFVGHYQGRLSYDYATGSAGILRLVSRMRDGEPSDLFLDRFFITAPRVAAQLEASAP